MVCSCAWRITPPSSAQELAIEIGTSSENALLATDGDQVVMEDSGLTLNRKKCQGHYIFSQGSIVETRHDLFKDRNILGKEGCVIARVSISEKDKILWGLHRLLAKAGSVQTYQALRARN